MNQILQTSLDNNKIKSLKLKKILKFQLYISIVLFVIISSILSYNIFHLNSKEQYSNQVLNNYNITKLYANLYSNNLSNSDEIIDPPFVLGIIEIPKIDVYYPVFSTCNDDLLKISPCKFYGPKFGYNR